jgi:antitoxin component of MazEF toxin-antitoxin module
MSCKDNSDNKYQNKIEYRKVQAIHGNSTFVLVLPRDFVSVLNISKGDYVKCSILNNKMVVEKIAN